MKICPWCNRPPMLSQNYKKHLDKCKYKNMNITQAQIETLIKHKDPNSEIIIDNKDEIINRLEEENMQMAHKMTEILDMLKEFQSRFVINKCKDVKELIDEMIIAESTKRNYRLEWSLFKSWKEKHNKETNIGSINTYISMLKCKPSTQIKKREILQQILRRLLGDNVVLNKIRKRFSYGKKYEMTNEEVDLYLAEQKNLSIEFHLVQYLMIRFALRISTIAAIKKQHISFKKKLIHFHTKNNKVIVKPLDDQTHDLLNDYTSGLDKNDHVFYREGNNDTLEKRTTKLMIEVNKRISETKALGEKDSNYTYTSHMFRRTQANLEIADDKKALMLKGNRILGQADGSSAVNHYINV
jgi:hypothetical protein